MGAALESAKLARQRAIEAAHASEAERHREEKAGADLRWTTAESTLSAASATLSDWFGDNVTWDIMDIARKGAAAGYGNGDSIVIADQDREVYLLVERMPHRNNRVTIYAVTSQVDSGTSYSYWSGPKVESLADIGRFYSKSH